MTPEIKAELTGGGLRPTIQVVTGFRDGPPEDRDTIQVYTGINEQVGARALDPGASSGQSQGGYPSPRPIQPVPRVIDAEAEEVPEPKRTVIRPLLGEGR